MNQSHLHRTLSAFVILIAIVACVVPSQTAIQPSPATNPNAIETTVAGTVQAAVEQTAAAQAIATEAPVGVTGTSIEQLQDGTTKYSDYDGGFEIIFPVGWLAVRPNSEEFNVSLAKDAAVNSMLHDQMTADQTGYDAESDRLYAYILRPDIQKNVMFGFSKLVWNSQDTVPIDSVTLGKLVRDLESSGAIPGFRADTAQLREYTDVNMIEIGGHWMMSDGQGGTIPFYATILFFKPSSNSIVRIIFSFLEDHHEQISTDIRFIMKSIRIIEP